jgi:hypothetical protein
MPSFHEQELLHVDLQSVKYIDTAEPQADNGFSFLNLIPKEGDEKVSWIFLKRCFDSSSNGTILKVPTVRDLRRIISNLSVAALNGWGLCLSNRVGNPHRS